MRGGNVKVRGGNVKRGGNVIRGGLVVTGGDVEIGGNVNINGGRVNRGGSVNLKGGKVKEWGGSVGLTMQSGVSHWMGCARSGKEAEAAGSRPPTPIIIVRRNMISGRKDAR